MGRLPALKETGRARLRGLPRPLPPQPPPTSEGRTKQPGLPLPASPRLTPAALRLTVPQAREARARGAPAHMRARATSNA